MSVSFFVAVLILTQGSGCIKTEIVTHLEVTTEPQTPVSIDLEPHNIFNSLKEKSSNKFLTQPDMKKSKSPNCAPKPNIYDLDYHNTYWQKLTIQNLILFLYAAYYDDRSKVGKEPVVRILSVSSMVEPKITLFCQFWYRDDTLTGAVTNTSQYDLIWNQKYIKLKDAVGVTVGQLITCPLPRDKIGATPVSVSLVARRCDRARNHLIVHNQRRSTASVEPNFLVCVKALDFPFDDLSAELIQFIEVNLLFGVDRIVFHNFGSHPNIEKVLSYYETRRKINVTSLTLPAGYPNEQFLRHQFIKARHTTKIIQELIPYNDCYYRHMHLYDYILLLDIDEVFVPAKVESYQAMIQLVQAHDKGKSFATYFARNKIFLETKNSNLTVGENEDVPPYLTMLKATSVAEDYEWPYRVNVKSFFNTQEVLLLNNHSPYKCLGGNGSCRKRNVPEEFGQLHHYRKKCFWQDGEECKAKERKNYKLKEDRLMLRYKEKLIDAVSRVMNDLKIIRTL